MKWLWVVVFASDYQAFDSVSSTLIVATWASEWMSACAIAHSSTSCTECANAQRRARFFFLLYSFLFQFFLVLVFACLLLLKTWRFKLVLCSKPIHITLTRRWLDLIVILLFIAGSKRNHFQRIKNHYYYHNNHSFAYQSFARTNELNWEKTKHLQYTFNAQGIRCK